MELYELDLNLIPTVHAQSSNASAQPTFGVIDIGGGNGSVATVNLTANQTNATVGQSFTVDININTGTSTSIKEYRVIIDFDTSKLQVVDAEANETGTQIDHLDTVFSTAAGGQNNVSSTGRITLIAKTPSGNAFTVNRKVATITFQGQELGSTTLTAVTGSAGSQLINGNNVALPISINNLNLTIQAQSNTGNNGNNGNNNNGGNTGTVNPPTQIPATAISAQDVVTMLPFIIGFTLIALGSTLTITRRRNRNAQRD